MNQKKIIAMETNENVMTPEEMAQLCGGIRYDIILDKDGNVTIRVILD
jgi:hypothetical protein